MLIQSISMESIVYFSAILMIITAIITFLVLLVIAAPYGKFTENKGWGPLVNAKIAWFVMESPNLISSYTLYSLYKNSDTFKFTNKILLLTFAIHYIHRTLIYPLRMHGANANPMPLSVMMLAFLFTSWNSFNQATYLTLIANYPDDWMSSIYFKVGIITFFVGMYINIQSDDILMKLRSSSSTGVKEYKIPRGGMFEYVSSANYFGEIVEWTGFAICSWSLTGAAFALYTFACLAPRAVKHHQWYLQKFSSYPKSRKAVIPFVW